MKYFPLKTTDPVAEQTRTIRERLYRILEELDGMAAISSPSKGQPTPYDLRAILKARRTRDRFFDPKLFADPAWDMLLELYAAELSQHHTSVSSLCIGAAVPATTALRWIKLLEREGLLVRTHDPMDARRTFVSLSKAAVSAMESLFGAVAKEALF